MKNIIFSGLILTASLFAKDSCYDKAITQYALNKCAMQDYRSSDKRLNKIYKKILKLYHNNPNFIKALKKAQRAWIVMRDAEIEMAYPGYKERPEDYGTILPMCIMNFKATLTEDRIKFLSQWLKKQVEGDVCSFGLPYN